jgi:NTP pyrophosphatase (non-canonical NTP hydrolase)
MGGWTIVMEMVEFQKHANRTANLEKTSWDISLTNFALGLAGEAGETVDYLKKVIFHGHEMNKQRLTEELGDCLWYVTTIATVAGISLEDVAWYNVQKLRKRYPNGFDEEKSRKREENECLFSSTR